MKNTAVKSCKCETCFKTFKVKCNFQRHQEIHKLQRPRKFGCSTCQKTFYTNEQLKGHVKVVHENIKSHTCIFCDKQFYARMELDRHILSHVSEKQFWCKKCEKEFSSSPALKVHMKQHNIEKPYSCNVCANTFVSKKGLRYHKFRHRAKLLECVMCRETFAYNQDLLTHIQSHTNEKPFFCHICDDEFKKHHRLKHHLQRNHKYNQKQLDLLNRQKTKIIRQCVFCLKTFSANKFLQQHIRSHLNEKPFVCSICEGQYKYIDGLRRHLKQNKCEQFMTASFEPLECDVCSLQPENTATLVAQSSHKDGLANGNSTKVPENATVEVATVLDSAIAGEGSPQTNLGVEENTIINIPATSKSLVCGVNSTQLQNEIIPEVASRLEDDSADANFPNQILESSTNSNDAELESTATSRETTVLAHQEEKDDDVIFDGVVKSCGICKERFSGEKADKKYAMHIVSEKYYVM